MMSAVVKAGPGHGRQFVCCGETAREDAALCSIASKVMISMQFSDLHAKASRPRSLIILSACSTDAKKFKEVFVEAQKIMQEGMEAQKVMLEELVRSEEQETAEGQEQGQETEGVTNKLAGLTVQESTQPAAADS